MKDLKLLDCAVAKILGWTKIYAPQGLGAHVIWDGVPPGMEIHRPVPKYSEDNKVALNDIVPELIKRGYIVTAGFDVDPLTEDHITSVSVQKIHETTNAPIGEEMCWDVKGDEHFIALPYCLCEALKEVDSLKE